MGSPGTPSFSRYYFWHSDTFGFPSSSHVLHDSVVDMQFPSAVISDKAFTDAPYQNKMSRATDSGSGAHPDQQHISFDFTVPSQENEFLHTNTMSTDSHGHGHGHGYVSPQTVTLRRKRSSSREEDEDEEEGGEDDEDDEYIPQTGGAGGMHGHGGGNHYYGGGSGHAESSYRRGSTSAGAGAGGGFGMGLTPLDVDMQVGSSSHTSTFRVAQRKAPQTVGSDGQPPPKKKRRRQALSCTECKRRKIRCDRAQPCAPCTRRGEGDKCKWNILEPVEKFVTRKEYDEIKDSLSRLETILTTTSPSGQGPSGSANDDVAAAVNMVKKQAGILSKVISSPLPSSVAPPPAIMGRGQSTSYGDVVTSGSIPTATSSFPRAPPRNSLPHHPDGAGGHSNASFAYNPFSLNVPSQSTGGVGGPSDVGDEDYYGSGARNTISSHSHSTSTEFSRPTSSTYQNTGHLQPMSGHFQSNMPASPYHGSTYSNQHQLIPEINLRGLVVEDQSQSSGVMLQGNADPSGPLSTLANLANASSMASSSYRSSGTHLQPMHNQHQNQGPGMNMAQPSPSLTLAPIGAHPVPQTGRDALSISTNAASGAGLTMLPPPSIAPPRLPLVGGGGNREAQLRRVLQTCLPRREICDRLVEYYFEKVEWSLTLLHRPTFMRACETFWFLSEDERAKIASPTTPSSATSWGGGFRASFLPPAADYSMGYANSATNASTSKKRQASAVEGHSVNPAWISLLLAVLCVSLERLGYWDAKSVGIVENVEQYQLYCRNLFDGSQTAMILGDFLKSRALESVQAMVLHMHCQQTFTTTNWEGQIGVTLSVAARLGMMMGLNKLTPEKVGSSQRPGLLKRELGRRAWWNLIERDWTLSPRVGHTYAINPAQNFCDLPANVEWEELVFSRNTFKQQQREVWTGVSSFLARIDMSRANRELTDQYNSPDGVSYNLLLKHEVLLEEAVSRTPPQLLNPDGEFELSTPQGQWDRIHFTFQKHYNTITLHRPYLVAAILDLKAQETRQASGQDSASPHNRNSPSYFKSLDTSIRSAEMILDTMEEAISSQYPGVQWWQTIISCYTAAVVLLVERWYKAEAKAGSLEAEDADERRRKIQAASALLREQCDAIDLFAQASNALDSLLDATTSARRKARKSGRRGMDINDVVNPVNVSSRASVTTGNTPPFIKDWIDRPGTPMPSSPEPVTRQVPSLSTMALLPGVPLVADTSYDSQFWARIFDLEFTSPPDMTELFFPSEGLEEMDEIGDNGLAGDHSAALFSGIAGSSAWRSTAMDPKGSSSAVGGSAIWSAMSGPIGSSASEEGWPRASPY